MIRKFAVALFAASTLSSSIAMALGLGEAKVSSTLNQPLEAEIELVSVRDLSTAEILPTLASQTDFQRAGVDRVHFLSDLKFKVVFRDANKAVIKVTSNKPVREPFLNFMVEVVWPSGRLLREYALLIDPPMFAPSRPTTLVAARGDQVAVPANSANRTANNSNRSSAGSTGNTNLASGSYGPTTRDDTLWGIAAQNRPGRSISTQQTMLAIQDLNPDAFIDGNINKLKAGQILRMPAITDAERRSFQQAVSEVSAQNRALAENRALGRRQLDSDASGSSPADATRPQGGVELKIVAAEDLQGEPSPSQSAGRKDGQVNGNSASAKLTDTLEKLDKTNRENQELQSRLQDLETQLQTLQRLVSLKDDQLAALQGQSAEIADQGAVSEADAAEQAAREAGTFADVQGADGPDSEQVDPNVSGTPATDSPLADNTAEGQPVESAPAVDEPSEPVALASAESKPAIAKPDVLPEPEPTLLERLMTDPMHQAFAGGGVALVLIMLWLVSRRSREHDNDADDALAYESNGEPVPDDDVLSLVGGAGAAATAGAAAPARIAGEDDDVLSEADIYVAYGRLDQASQLLENALESQPERTDARVKLLEIYAQAGNTSAFEQHFAVLQTSGDDDAIQRAEMMRVELPEAAWDEQALDEPEISLDDLEHQLMAGSSQFQAPVEQGQADEVDTDVTAADESDESHFTLGDEVSEASAETALAATASPEEELDNLDVEFDISELDLEDGVEDAPASELGSEKTLELDDSLDLDDALELNTPAVPAATQPIEGETERSESGLELGDFELELDEGDDVDVEQGASNEFALDDALDLGELTEAGAETELSPVSEPAESDELEMSSEAAELNLSVESDDLESALDLEALEPETLQPEAELNLADEDDVELELDSELAPVAESSVDDVLSDEEIEQLEGVEDVSAELDLDDEVELEEDDFDFLAGTDEAATKLDLARAYIDMGDAEGARDILEEVAQEGNDQQKQDALDLLKGLE